MGKYIKGYPKMQFDLNESIFSPCVIKVRNLRKKSFFGNIYFTAFAYKIKFFFIFSILDFKYLLENAYI